MVEDNQTPNPSSPASLAPAADTVSPDVSNPHPPSENGSYCLPARRRNVPTHKDTCTCRVCLRIQASIDSGRPSKAELRAAGFARKEERQAAKRARDLAYKEAHKPLTSREAKIRRDAMVESSLASQVLCGTKPSLEKAAKVAGIHKDTARTIVGSDFVTNALSRAGITDDSLATLAAEGLDAFTQKIITDNDGNIIDVVNMPDWRNRHAFWRDILMAKKILGGDADAQPSGGGLIIITPDSAKVIEGHPPACVCEKCCAAWEEKTKYLRRASMRANSIDTDARMVESEEGTKNAADANAEDNVNAEDDPTADDFGPIE